jgi:hypothetical protein
VSQRRSTAGPKRRATSSSIDAPPRNHRRIRVISSSFVPGVPNQNESTFSGEASCPEGSCVLRTSRQVDMGLYLDIGNEAKTRGDIASASKALGQKLTLARSGRISARCQKPTTGTSRE